MPETNKVCLRVWHRHVSRRLRVFPQEGYSEALQKASPVIQASWQLNFFFDNGEAALQIYISKNMQDFFTPFFFFFKETGNSKGNRERREPSLFLTKISTRSRTSIHLLAFLHVIWLRSACNHRTATRWAFSTSRI